MMDYSRVVTASFSNELEWLLILKPTTIVQNGVKLVFSAFIYWKWRTINDIIFKGVSKIVDTIEHMISEVRMKMCVIKYVMEQGQGRERMMNRWGIPIEVEQINNGWVKWEKPPPCYVEMNTDRSLKNMEGKLGAVIINTKGDH